MKRTLSLTVERVAFNHRDAGSTPAEYTNFIDTVADRTPTYTRRARA